MNRNNNKEFSLFGAIYNVYIIVSVLTFLGSVSFTVYQTPYYIQIFVSKTNSSTLISGIATSFGDSTTFAYWICIVATFLSIISILIAAAITIRWIIYLFTIEDKKTYSITSLARYKII